MSMPRKDGNSWNWGTDTRRNLRYFSDLPPVEEDEHRNISYDSVPIYAEDEEADATYRSQRPRSPIQKITRGFVEEEKPVTRNFGDYDPVRGPRTTSSSFRVRRFEPTRLESRKVVYRGIPENRSAKSIRCRVSEFEDEESEGEDFGYNDPVCMDPKNQHGQTENNERFKFSEYCRNEGAPTLFSTLRGSTQGNQELSNYSTYSKQTPYQPYSVNTFSRRTVNSDSPTGYPYTNKNLTSMSQLNKGSYLSFMPKATPTQPQSSWMAFTQGTGFYQQPGSTSTDTNRGHLLASNSSEHADKMTPFNRAGDQCLSTESKPTFEYGYWTGKEALSTSEECTQPGRHEALFCEKAISQNLFYRLKRLPDYEVYGTIYYSYEIEFWPFRNHSLKETVTGHQMADKFAAKDSVFAAALKKLDSVIPETTPYTSGHLIKSETRPQILKTVSEAEPNRKLIVSQERARVGSQVPSRTRIVFEEEIRTTGSPHVPDLVRARAVFQQAGPTRAVFQETDSTRTVLQGPDRASQLAKDVGPSSERKMLDLKTPSEKEGSQFRIAIPRGPSIIWDGSRPRSQNSKRRNRR